MKSLRLLLITRRFWPLVGSAERGMARLAVELRGRVCEVSVLSARWEPQWPAAITVRGVPVVRLPHSPGGRWETFRYVRSMGRRLRENRERFDLVYVSGLKHEAHAALRAMRGRVPVVLWPEAAGRYGDCLWQIDTFLGRRIKRQCMKAAALVGRNAAIDRELKAAGYPRPRIHHIPDGVPIPPRGGPVVKAAARAALAEANTMLQVPGSAPVALYVGRLQSSRGLRYLVEAWRTVVSRWPNVRLWLVGEGSRREELVQQIAALNLIGRVVPVGVFDEVDELLCAADLFVLPSPTPGTPLALLEAMAAGLPIVAGETPGVCELLADGRHALLVPTGDPAALSAAVARLIDQPDLSRRLGTAARELAEADFSLAKMVDAHVALFESLIRPESKPPGPSPVAQDNP